MKQSYVLGVHPSSRGFGWALFEGPLVPFDWGIVGIKGDKNSGALVRFEELLDQYEPRVMALESFDEDGSKRSARVRRLCRGLVNRAEARGIKVRVYTRVEISQTFVGTKAETREEIAAAVAERVAVLRSRLPKPRKAWQSEHPNIALFAAAACALTYLMGRRT